MNEMRNRTPVAAQPYSVPVGSASNYGSSSSRSQRAREAFKLYAADHPDSIGKEAAILCLTDLLRDKYLPFSHVFIYFIFLFGMRLEWRMTRSAS
jgi:hypothetical protein